MPRPATPTVTVDAIIRIRTAEGLDLSRVVLIERLGPPTGWALPGGFVDLGERLEDACIREAREETGLAIRPVALLGIYSAPDRDPRGHTVSAVYVTDSQGTPEAADDARSAAVFDLSDLPVLAFDHAMVMDDYRRYLERGEFAPLRWHR